ncbi:MAG: hypothetical protein AB1659_10255 [Thermodesulfobacteriota bacterium]
MIYWGIYLLSFSSLSFEILLTRIFSITQWNHLSFMVISIALLGFGASGTVCSIFDSRIPGWSKKIIDPDALNILVTGYSLLSLVVLFLLTHIPFDYFRLPFEPIQAGYLFILYTGAAVPFFIAGIAILGGYAALPEKSGILYFAAMTGSACGALFPIPLLPVLEEAGTGIVACMIPVFFPILRIFRFFSGPASPSAKISTVRFQNTVSGLVAVGILFLGVHQVFLSEKKWFVIRPSDYKSLSQLLKYPDTHIRTSTSSIRGRIDIVESDYIRYAPGLSLKFTDALPHQKAAFRDGDHPLIFFEKNMSDPFLFALHSLSSAGYLLCPNPNRVLIIEHGGGSGIPTALASNAGEILLVEQNPDLAKWAKSHYHLPVVADNPRSFMAATSLKFDIIHIENWGASLMGAAALSQEYLFTREAFHEYLSHLDRRGVLVISRRIRLPPSDMVRLWSTAFESLECYGVERPEAHIAILRNWDTFTLLVSLTPIEIDPLLIEFSNRLNFDFAYSFPQRPELSNRFNRFEEPYHFQALKAAQHSYLNKDSERFHHSYLLDVSPQSDNRPFPERFFKWPNIKSIYEAGGSRFFSLFMSGEIIVGLVFIEAIGAASLLILFSIAFLPKTEEKPVRSRSLYFICLGTGFMFLELYFIKAFTLLFADPVISFTLVITALLIFSGAGGIGSQKVSVSGIQVGCFLILGLLALFYWILDDLIRALLPFAPGYRILFSIAVLIPSGILIGVPFPAGMRLLADTSLHRSHAWLVNGCASVLASVLSMQLAVSFGIDTLLIFSGVSYLTALLCVIVERGSPELMKAVNLRET